MPKNVPITTPIMRPVVFEESDVEVKITDFSKFTLPSLNPT